MRLGTKPNLPDPDEACAALRAAHTGLTGAQSHALNPRQVLILMNHAGSAETRADALALARTG